MGRLGTLLGLRDALTRAAHGGDRRRFAERFAGSTVYFLCLPQRFAEGLSADASQEAILEQIEEAAKDLAESPRYRPMVYVSDGCRRMPLFSNNQLAAEFAKWYALFKKRIIPLQVLGADGMAIVPAFKDCDVVALNDRTEHEYLLTEDDVLLLRSEGPMR
jgi:hypothetical protein